MNEEAGSINPSGGIPLVVCLAAAVASGFLAFNNHLLLAWVLILVSLAMFTFACGQKVTGRWMGALIDGRNVMSLSRFQIVLWTLLILSAYFTAALHNIFSAQSNPLNVQIHEQLWWLMGISTASLVGSPLILKDKLLKAPDLTEMSTTFQLLEKQGDQGSTLDVKGHIVVNTDISKARWSDMFTGEEVGNAAHMDVARLQMFFFTLIAALAYAAYLFHEFYGAASGAITSLPELDKSIVALIAISHTGYLAAKATPHSQAGAGQPKQAAAADADEYPPVG